MGRSPLRLSSDGLAMRVLTSPYLAVTVAMLCWAGSTVVVRGLRAEVPPLGLSFWRTLLGAALVLPFAWRPMMLQIHLIRRHFWIILLLSFLLIVAGNGVLFLSLQYTIAINVGVLNSFEPLLIIVAAWAIFRDRVTFNQLAGVLVSLLGVFALIGRGDPGTILDLDFNAGDILVLFAYLSWAFYAVYLRLAPRELDPARDALPAIVSGLAAADPVLRRRMGVRPADDFRPVLDRRDRGPRPVFIGRRDLSVELFDPGISARRGRESSST